MKQLILNIRLNETPSLANFYVGPNIQLLQQLTQLQQQSHKHFNIVYIWGEPSSGKSHLLRSMYNHWPTTSAWLDSTNQTELAYQSNWRLICLDEMDKLTSTQQHLAFSWLAQAQTDQITVLAAGSCPPADLPVREDLRSRLGWGQVYRLQPLDDSQLSHWLMHQAELKGIKLTPDVIQYMLLNLARDLRFLEQLLQQLDKLSLEQHRRITIPFLKQTVALLAS